MQIGDIIITSAQAALGKQQGDGAFPPGCNGPYHDPETPVRNTGHWLMVFCKAYELSGQSDFKQTASRAARYLTSQETRPMGATFYCRRNPEKDFCNGLTGQAWVIESLIAASETLGDSSYRQLAKQVLLLHPFDERLGLWRRVNVDGSYSTFDMTFNHQLWFAVAGSLLDSDPDTVIGSRVTRFLDRTLVSHLRLSRSGRIIHFLRSVSKKRRMAKKLYSLVTPFQTFNERKQMAHMEIGYHAFNLYAFSMLNRRMPDHPLWQSDGFMSALRFVSRGQYARRLENNKYAYPYNPAGIEIAFALLTFADQLPGNAEDPAVRWVSGQLERTFDLEHSLMQKNTDDPVTLAARIYEATRLPDVASALTAEV